MISVFSVARDEIFIHFFSVPNSLQLEYVCNVDNTENTVLGAEISQDVIYNPYSPVRHQT